MKRMTFVAITFCLLLLATGGAGVLAAEQKLPPQYRVVQFDVTYNNEVVGRLSVNTNEWTYVLNAHGLQPATKYYFYRAGKFSALGSETTNGNGDLHMGGAWDTQAANIISTEDSPEPTFFLAPGPMPGGYCKPTRIIDSTVVIALFYTHVEGNLQYEGYGYYGPIWGPLPNQPVHIYWWDKGSQSFELWATPITSSNGHFAVTKAFMKNAWLPQIYFQGGTHDGYPLCTSWG